MTERLLPSIVGCAVGFCAAGCGIGSLVGTAFGSWPFPPLPAGQGTPRERVLAFYGGTFVGMAAGMAFGVAAGVAYAVILRRIRRERVNHSE